MAVRRHRAAGMQVRVDQRSERLGALDPGIEVEPKLAREDEVGTLPGRDDDAVDRPERPRAVSRLAFEDHLLAGPPHRGGREAEDQGHLSAVDEILHVRAELAAGGQLVGEAAAVDADQVGAAHDPHDLGLRVALGELREVDQDVRRRVAGADDRRRAALVGGAVAPEDVRQAVGDLVGVLGLAVGRDAAGAERVRASSKCRTRR